MKLKFPEITKYVKNLFAIEVNSNHQNTNGFPNSKFLTLSEMYSKVVIENIIA